MFHLLRVVGLLRTPVTLENHRFKNDPGGYAGYAENRHLLSPPGTIKEWCASHGNIPGMLKSEWRPYSNRGISTAERSTFETER